MTGRLRALLNIRTDESRTVALVIGVMLLTSAGFTFGSKGVETLFYTRYGVEYLPYMFLWLGVLSIVISLGTTALLGRIRREQLYILVPIGVVVATILAWLLLFSRWKLIFPILWLGKEVINSLVSLVVWGIAGTVCNTRQSKRLFPLFNAGRILGAVLGGFGTGLLVNQIGTQNLLLVWAVMLLFAFILTRALLLGRVPTELPRKIRRRQKRFAFVQEIRQSLQFVRGSSLLKWISVSAILFSILYRCIELPFAQAATTHFSDEKSLAGFLGLFDGLTTAAAFLTSTLIANRLYVRFGIMNAILALPIIYLFGFAGITISNAFVIVIIFRFLQMLWLSGIADSAYQAMFNAVPSTRRDQVRAFIGGAPEQAGTFLAGLITIIFLSHQLAIVGLVSAVVTTFIIWRASRAYNFALVDALRSGRPTIFAERAQFDAAALNAAHDGMKNPDLIVRRVSAEILGGHSSESDILVHALLDEDINVRSSALKGLVRLQASSALLDVAALLSDPQPVIRAQAADSLRALTPHPRGLSALLIPMLTDSDAQVRIRIMVALLSIDSLHPVRTQLRQISILGNVEERILALNALAEISDPEALILFSNELQDEGAPIPVRCAAALALGTCGMQAIPVLVETLSAEQISLKASAASALGKIGDASLPVVLDALADISAEEGALLALEQLSAWKEAGRVREYVKRRVESAVRFDELRLAVHRDKNDRMQLLGDALQSRSRRDGIFALRALSFLGARETISVAIENLKGGQQISNALEALDAIRSAALIRPMLHIWEPAQETPPSMNPDEVITDLLNENDDWLRACAVFAKEESMETLTTLSMMERVLLLHRVPLLATLSSSDLQNVAAIATEQDFSDGEVICEQGEMGNEMFVIASGEVRVSVENDGQPARDIARRAAGDVVGEISLISGDTRIATVTALGEVRTLCIDRLNFESLLRERPEVTLAIMRELYNRLREKG